MSEAIENKLTITSKEVENSMSASFKHLQIPESVLQSMQAYRTQMVELSNNINRAMIPIQPLLPSLQKMAEFVKEATAKMQPLWNVYKTSIEHMRSLEAMTRNQKFDLTGLRHEVILSQPKYRYQTFPSPREIAQETAKEMLKILEQKKKSPSNQRITIHFSKDGDLYTNDKHHYSL